MEENKSKEILEKNWRSVTAVVKEELPEITHGFGYGSGVNTQTGYDYTEDLPLIDLIFIVENQKKWHKLNYKTNRHHYTGISYFLGANYINFVNKFIFPISFFPNIELRSGHKIKYGVLDYETAIKDLENWNILALAGRMQKPIKEIPTLSSIKKEKLLEAQRKNLEMAYFYSYQNLLEDQESDPDFDDILEEVVSLSYKGDIRMDLNAESGSKINDIFEGNKEEFYLLYSGFKGKSGDDGVKFPKLMCDQKIRKINRRSSFRMSFSQLLLGSLSQNISYVGRKMMKAISKK